MNELYDYVLPTKFGKKRTTLIFAEVTLKDRMDLISPWTLGMIRACMLTTVLYLRGL